MKCLDIPLSSLFDAFHFFTLYFSSMIMSFKNLNTCWKQYVPVYMLSKVSVSIDCYMEFGRLRIKPHRKLNMMFFSSCLSRVSQMMQIKGFTPHAVKNVRSPIRYNIICVLEKLSTKPLVVVLMDTMTIYGKKLMM